MEQIAHAWRVVAGDTQLFAYILVEQLGQSLRRLHAQAVQVEVPGELASVEQPLGLLGSPVTDGYHRECDHVELSRFARQKEVGDREFASFPLAWKGEALDFTPSGRVVQDDIVPMALTGEVSVHDFGLEPALSD